MFNLNCYEWFFIVSVSLQLSGAVLLLIKYTFVNTEKQIQEIEKKENHIEGSTFVLGQTQPTKEEYRENVSLNRQAFTYIALGYLLSIWGSISQGSRYIILFWVLVVSSIIVIISYRFSKRRVETK